MMPPTPAGPLDGVTVLDLCSYLAGPYGCSLLADLGARVIKVESPRGDMLRQFPSSLPGESRCFPLSWHCVSGAPPRRTKCVASAEMFARKAEPVSAWQSVQWLSSPDSPLEPAVLSELVSDPFPC
jgi:CoA-transferase family III